MKLIPTMLSVAHAGLTDPVRGPLVSLTATWIMTSGERYEVTVQLLSHFACASLVLLLSDGSVGPLGLLALNQPL